MTLRSILFTVLVIGASFATSAHDSALHERKAKAKLTTCAQYADRENYSNDLNDPEIKALKDSCDAKAKESEKSPKQ